jgi:hypothetical protein
MVSVGILVWPGHHDAGRLDPGVRPSQGQAAQAARLHLRKIVFPSNHKPRKQTYVGLYII